MDQFLPELHNSRDIRAGEHDLVEGMQKVAKIAKKKIGKLERTSMGAELDMAGRSVEHSMSRLGESTMSNVHRDRRSVGKETSAVGRGAEHEASPMGRSMQDDLRKGKHTVNGGFRATERDQPTTQDHGRVEGRTPNKTSNKIQSVRGVVNPVAQPTSVYNRQPAVSHPSKVPMQSQRPLDRRSEQNGGKKIQSHSGPPKHPRSPMTAQHDQARMPVDAKQLHLSPSPARPRAPSQQRAKPHRDSCKWHLSSINSLIREGRCILRVQSRRTHSIGGPRT